MSHTGTDASQPWRHRAPQRVFVAAAHAAAKRRRTQVLTPLHSRAWALWHSTVTPPRCERRAAIEKGLACNLCECLDRVAIPAATLRARGVDTTTSRTCARACCAHIFVVTRTPAGVAAAPLRCAAHVATGGGHIVACSSASIILSVLILGVVLTWRACSARGSSGRRGERFVHACAAGT